MLLVYRYQWNPTISEVDYLFVCTDIWFILLSLSLTSKLCDISFLVQSQSCLWALTADYIEMWWEAKGQREDREMCERCLAFSLTSSDMMFPPFALCMCSFLTRTRGNAHSSSSSICSVNSLWVITSLIQLLNPPITLLCSSFLSAAANTPPSSGVVLSVIIQCELS